MLNSPWTIPSPEYAVLTCNFLSDAGRSKEVVLCKVRSMCTKGGSGACFPYKKVPTTHESSPHIINTSLITVFMRIFGTVSVSPAKRNLKRIGLSQNLNNNSGFVQYELCYDVFSALFFAHLRIWSAPIQSQIERPHFCACIRGQCWLV